jgi:hypothetical protein
MVAEIHGRAPRGGTDFREGHEEILKDWPGSEGKLPPFILPAQDDLTVCLLCAIIQNHSVLGGIALALDAIRMLDRKKILACFQTLSELTTDGEKAA